MIEILTGAPCRWKSRAFPSSVSNLRRYAASGTSTIVASVIESSLGNPRRNFYREESRHSLPREIVNGYIFLRCAGKLNKRMRQTSELNCYTRDTRDDDDIFLILERGEFRGDLRLCL